MLHVLLGLAMLLLAGLLGYWVAMAQAHATAAQASAAMVALAREVSPWPR